MWQQFLQGRSERRNLAFLSVAVDVNPTAENIARLIFEHARGAGFPVVEVQLVEQQGSIASYCP